jgi:hypothetical protein
VDDSHSSGGANIVISSISFVEGATSGVGGAGGRELVVECDSSYKAEVPYTNNHRSYLYIKYII